MSSPDGVTVVWWHFLQCMAMFLVPATLEYLNAYFGLGKGSLSLN